MIKRLVAEVTSAFKALLEDGFRVIDEHAEESFGNATVTLGRGHVRVRVSTDRGDALVEVASSSEPNNWYVLRPLLTVLTGRDVGEVSADLALAAELIGKYASALEQELEPARFAAFKAKLASHGDVGEADRQQKLQEYARRLKGN